MGKLVKFVFCLLLIYGIVMFIPVVRDKKMLGDHLLRLHVVGASNSFEDQSIKLEVRDAVVKAVSQWTSSAKTKEEACHCIEEKLDELVEVVNTTLKNAKINAKAEITLMQEAFPARQYDTFSLPSGVYDSLRIVIGEGKGANWWCVVFPELCLPTATEKVADLAVSSGFSDDLSKTVTQEPGYEVRFYILDFLGRIENFLFAL